MEISGLILAKSQSNRLPGKNLKEFRGKPLFLWNVEKALTILDKVYVSSDSDEILDWADSVGALAIKRPEELCGETPNITVYRHAIKYMDDTDAIIAIQANSPGIPPAVIKQAKFLMESGIHELMTCHPIQRHPDYHRQSWKIYGSLWGITRERLHYYGSPYKPDPEIVIVDDSIDIETEEDFNNALIV